MYSGAVRLNSIRLKSTLKQSISKEIGRAEHDYIIPPFPNEALVLLVYDNKVPHKEPVYDNTESYN